MRGHPLGVEERPRSSGGVLKDVSVQGGQRGAGDLLRAGRCTPSPGAGQKLTGAVVEAVRPVWQGWNLVSYEQQGKKQSSVLERCMAR